MCSPAPFGVGGDVVTEHIRAEAFETTQVLMSYLKGGLNRWWFSLVSE